MVPKNLKQFTRVSCKQAQPIEITTQQNKNTVEGVILVMRRTANDVTAMRPSVKNCYKHSTHWT